MPFLPPFVPTADGTPSLLIGGAVITIERAGGAKNGRWSYRWCICLGNKRYGEEALFSRQGNLQRIFDALLTFLLSAVHTDEIGLFPVQVMKWAVRNRDELIAVREMLQSASMPLIVN